MAENTSKYPNISETEPFCKRLEPSCNLFKEPEPSCNICKELELSCKFCKEGELYKKLYYNLLDQLSDLSNQIKQIQQETQKLYTSGMENISNSTFPCESEALTATHEEK